MDYSFVYWAFLNETLPVKNSARAGTEAKSIAANAEVMARRSINSLTQTYRAGPQPDERREGAATPIPLQQ
jgi:hypothetical protein